MKRNLCFVLLIILCYILQTAVFPYLLLAGIAPNLLLIIVVAIGYMRGSTEAMFYGLLCGLLLDCQYNSIIGVDAFLYMLIGYLVGNFNLIYDRDDYTLPIVLVGVSDFIFNFLFYIISFLLRKRTNILFYVKRIMLPELVYTVVISIFLYKLIHTIIVNIENISRKES